MEYKEKSRVEEDVKLIKEFSYERPAFRYGMEEVHIYMFEDKEGQKLVWKTTGVLCIDRENKIGGSTFNDPEFPNIGSLIRIKGTVKGFDTYKGEDEVVLTRVKLLDIIEQAKSYGEIREEKRQEQIDSLKGEDELIQMPYSQYKQHYSDCETVIDSYTADNEETGPMITVIVREGRMKNSGVRGKHFDYYRLKNEEDKLLVYKAVCEENALKRAAQEYPNHIWKNIGWR